jgi:hypothetical protein
MPIIFHAFGGAIVGATLLGALGGLYGYGWAGVIVGVALGGAFGLVG